MIFSLFQRSAVEQYHAATQTNYIVEEDDGYGEQWLWESDWERPGVYRGPACRFNVTQYEVRWPSAHLFHSTSTSTSKTSKSRSDSNQRTWSGLCVVMCCSAHFGQARYGGILLRMLLWQIPTWALWHYTQNQSNTWRLWRLWDGLSQDYSYVALATEMQDLIRMRTPPDWDTISRRFRAQLHDWKSRPNVLKSEGWRPYAYGSHGDA